ncbi:MAG: hypothetical protein KJ977_03955, partial [Candidatus Omnitrophica bacterium]|nr:hypothetical protein [Candidatus Omnitrophota bacterium]
MGLLLFLNAPCLIPEIDPLKAQDAGETDQASSSSASSPAQEVDRLEEIALHKGTRQAEQALSRIEALCAREDLEDSFYVSLARAITRITQSRKSLIRFSTVSALESLFTKRGLDVEVYLSAAGAVRTIRQQRKQLIRPHSLAEVVSKMPEDVARFSMVSWRVYYNQRFMAITKSLRASEIAKYSIALAAHDFLRQHKLETTDQDNITKAVNVIVQIRNDEQALNRRLFLDRVINILNSHQSFGSQKVETFERSGKNTIDSPYKGRNSKMPALEAVAGSQGPLTIFFSGFSNGEYLCLERRAIDSDPSNDPQDNIHFTELAEALLGRGDLENLTIILDACYSYNFSVRLLNYLNQKGVKGLPIVVTSSYYNQKSYAATLPDALAAVYVDKGSPLTVFDILKVDEKVFNFWQNATLIVPWSRESIREIIEQAKPETISSRPDVLLPEPGESMVPTVAASPLGAKETSPEVLNPKTSSPAQEKGVISIDERYEVLEEITSLGQKALRAIGRPYQMQVAVRDKQSGKKSEVTLSIHRGPAQVKRQKEHDLIITKDKIQHLTRIADGNRNQKQLVREIINGFDGEIYLYSGPMIGVFKVTLPQAKQAIAIHQDLAHNPISIFNAAAQYHMSISRDVERKKLWFEFKTKQLKVIVPNGNYFTLPLTSDTAIEIAEALSKDQNNLLQVLQRELFGDLDKVFQADLSALEALNKSTQASPEQALYRVPYILSLYAKGQQRIVVVHQRIMPFGEFREWKRQELSSGRQVGKSESPFSIAGEDSRSFTNLLRALEEELAVTTNPTRQANIKDIKSKVLPAFEGKLSFASSSLTNEDFITIANADHRDLEAAFK